MPAAKDASSPTALRPEPVDIADSDLASGRCISDQGMTICYGPRMEEVKREDRGERWCFACRKRRPFVFIITAPVGMSYYGPSASVECDRGHYDGDLFPGRYREWEEAG